MVFRRFRETVREFLMIYGDVQNLALFAGGLKAHPNQSKDRCSTGRCLEKNLKT